MLCLALLFLGAVSVCGADEGDLLVNRPDFVVYRPRLPFSRQVSRSMETNGTCLGDSYNDHFHVLYDGRRRFYYAFWTQATWEGCVDQHIVFSRSADGGRTWTDPVVLAGGEMRTVKFPRASWQQPMLARSGRLYCLWNQQTTERPPHYGELYGRHSDDGGVMWTAPQPVPFPERLDQDNPDPKVPPCWCNWQRPLRLGLGDRFFVGCSRHGRAPYDGPGGCKVEFWQFENIDDDPEVRDIRLSFFNKNREAFSADRVERMPGVPLFVPVSNKWDGVERPAVEEASVMKLPDGRLFAVMRSSLGSPVWSQSRDCGRTWSAPRQLLDEAGKPIPHPRSPCPFYDWKGPEAGSGWYFGLVHLKFDYASQTAYQSRGPLYLIPGRYDEKGAQPVRFGKPRLFAPRKNGNSFYTSYTVVDGKGVLWFNDRKYWLLGRTIGEDWFSDVGDRHLTVRPARPDGEATSVVQGAIDACFRAGGGEVRLAKGEWSVGGIRLRSRVTLYLESGARLVGLRDWRKYFVLEKDAVEPVDPKLISHVGWIRADYVDKDTFHRYPGNRWNNALIRLYRATDAAIVGEPGSEIDGNNAYDPEGEENYRGPLGINAIGCRNLTLRGYTVQDAGNWAHRIVDTDNLLIEDVTCLAGHDSIHFNGCNDVRIENCTLKTGDDCIAGFDNRRVTVRGCYLNTSCSCFRFGGVDVLIEKCVAKGPGEYGFRGALTRAEKEAGAPTPKGTRNNMLSFFTYYADRTCPIREDAKRIVVRDCTVENADRFFHYNYFNEQWQKGAPLKDVVFERVKATGVKLPLCSWGDAYEPLDLTLRDCALSFAAPVAEFAKGSWLKSLTLENVTVKGVQGPLLRLWNEGTRPKVTVKDLKGVEGVIAPGEGEFKVKGI